MAHPWAMCTTAFSVVESQLSRSRSQVDVGACCREDVALWQLASITEQDTQEGKGVGYVIAMQMHRRHGWLHLRLESNVT